MQAKRLCFLARRRHDAAARPRHAARASARLPQLNFGCPPTLAGAVQLWEPRTGTDSWHSGSVRVTRNIRRAGAYGRAGWLVIGSRMARGGAPRRRLDTQRYRSSGRRDLSGCLRPCLIAYYDLCFLGTDSRMAAGFFECGLCVHCWRRYLCIRLRAYWDHCTSVPWRTRAVPSATLSGFAKDWQDGP